MTRIWVCVVVTGWTLVWSASGADPERLSEQRLQERMNRLSAEREEPEKLRQAQDIAQVHWLSSLQVKAIAMRLSNDDARLEFATTAYPRTVDPENFYEVYDAFSTFSKVMRLHDRVRQFHQPPPGRVVAVPPPQPMNQEEMKDILQALRKESFDNTRSQVARQILGSSRKNFLASQIKQMLSCFDFEPAKLEMAKFAYDYTLDKERYFLVNDAFDFPATKETLARYVESKRK